MTIPHTSVNLSSFKALCTPWISTLFNFYWDFEKNRQSLRYKIQGFGYQIHMEDASEWEQYLLSISEGWIL